MKCLCFNSVDVNELGSPNKSILLASESLISYEDCYEKMLHRILESVDQREFTTELEKTNIDGELF